MRFQRCGEPERVTISDGATFESLCKRRNNIAENQRVVILTGLVSNNARIGAVRRTELVLSCIRGPGCQAEEESLNGNDVNGIDHGVAIHIGSRPPASWREFR